MQQESLQVLRRWFEQNCAMAQATLEHADRLRSQVFECVGQTGNRQKYDPVLERIVEYIEAWVAIDTCLRDAKEILESRESIPLALGRLEETTTRSLCLAVDCTRSLSSQLAGAAAMEVEAKTLRSFYAFAVTSLGMLLDASPLPRHSLGEISRCLALREAGIPGAMM